jgi:hypothetical protein
MQAQITLVGFCRCGCGETVPGDRRYRAGHSAVRPIAARYKIDASGCWIWQRYVDSQGYAQIWRDGGNTLAHRVYYEERHGHCPPTLDHLCRNRACVNPDHLEPCGRGENVRRGNVAKVDWATVAEIRERAARMDGSHRTIARALEPDYPIVARTIRQILGGRRWPEAARPVEA